MRIAALVGMLLVGCGNPHDAVNFGDQCQQSGEVFCRGRLNFICIPDVDKGTGHVWAGGDCGQHFHCTESPQHQINCAED